MPELSIENLHVYRGEQHVLRGLNAQVSAGQCLQITGENGAGKTTLLRVLCGLLPAESLQLTWRGRVCSPQDAEYHQGLSYLSHAAPLKADLTGWENLRFLLSLRGVWQAERVGALLERLGARRFADRPVRSLSAGQRRRLALVGLVASQSQLWLLDEPTTNLDSAGTRLVTELLSDHLERGGLAMVATHVSLDIAPSALQSLHLTSGDGARRVA
jgi:heme exporter protein A